MAQQHVISPEGFAKLKAEWEDLKFTQRPGMVKQVSDAAAEGDRSENAAYTYGKMRLRDIDRRLRFLDRLLDSALVVDAGKTGNHSEIAFGATVKVLAQGSGQQREYKFVGPAEIDPMQGCISLQSPIGLALKGKRVGDQVTVVTPKGPQELKILEIVY